MGCPPQGIRRGAVRKERTVPRDTQESLRERFVAFIFRFSNETVSANPGRASFTSVCPRAQGLGFAGRPWGGRPCPQAPATLASAPLPLPGHPPLELARCPVS